MRSIFGQIILSMMAFGLGFWLTHRTGQKAATAEKQDMKPASGNSTKNISTVAKATKRQPTRAPTLSMSQAEAQLLQVLTQSPQDEDAIAKAAEALAKHDRSRAVTLLAQATFANSGTALSQVLQSSKNIKPLLEMLQKYPRYAAKQSFTISGALAKLAKADPMQALELWTHAGYAWDKNATESVAAGLYNKGPLPAIQYINNMAAGPRKEVLLSALVSEWFREESKGALAWLKQLPKKELASLKIDWQKFARTPAEIVDILTLYGESPAMRRILARGFYFRGNELKPEPGMVDWLSGITLPSARDYLATRFAILHAESHPELSRRAAALVGSERSQRLIANAKLAVLAKKDADAALEAAFRTPAGRSRDTAVEQVISTVESADPQKAMAFLDRHWDKLSARARKTLGGALADDYPREIAQRALKEPDTEVASSWLSGVIHEWTRQDAAAASAWVAALQPSELKQRAIERLVDVGKEHDPENATQWALQLENEYERLSGLKDCYFVLLNQNPALAENWLTRNKHHFPNSWLPKSTDKPSFSGSMGYEVDGVYVSGLNQY